MPILTLILDSITSIKRDLRMDWHKEMLFNAVAMSSLLFSSCDVELLNRVGAKTTDKLSMVILFTDAFAATSARNLKNTEREEK